MERGRKTEKSLTRQEKAYIFDAKKDLIEGIRGSERLKVCGSEGHGNSSVALRKSENYNNKGKSRINCLQHDCDRMPGNHQLNFMSVI